jgi:hypothetical protein
MQSRIVSLERALIAALTAAALIAPTLHAFWTHRLANSSDGAGVTRAADAPHPFGGSSDGTCGACLASDQVRTAPRGPSESTVAALETTPQRASRPDTALRGILLLRTAPPRAPPVA